MTNYEKFMNFIAEHRMQFDLKVHTHSDLKETKVEVISQGKIAISTHDENEEVCYEKALNDSIEWTSWQITKIEDYLVERKAI